MRQFYAAAAFLHSEATAETYKDIIIRSAVIEAEERIHVDGKIWSDLID